MYINFILLINICNKSTYMNCLFGVLFTPVSIKDFIKSKPFIYLYIYVQEKP